MKRQSKEQQEQDRRAKWDQEARGHLADPDALCKTRWFISSMYAVGCQRPIAQSIPHEHRAIEDRSRQVAIAWATPGNFHNDFEQAIIYANARAWLEEPLDART